VNTFCGAITNDIKNTDKYTNNNKSNLSKYKKWALDELQKRNDIIIDKGGAVVIQDVSNYIKEAN